MTKIKPIGIQHVATSERGQPENPLKITATVIQSGDGPPSYVALEPDFGVLAEDGSGGGRSIQWIVNDVPAGYRPTIEVMCFELQPSGDKTTHVFLQPFKRLDLQKNLLKAAPYNSTAGVFWYEVVLVPELEAGGQEIRLYCTTREMGGLEILPPPPPPPNGGG